MQITSLGWVLFIVSGVALAKPPAAGLVGPIVDKLQKKWDSIQTYQAGFTQVIFQKSLGTRDESKGVLSVAKPHRLRWDSQTDDQVEIINGKEIWILKTNKRRGTTTVDHHKDNAALTNSHSLGFLSGKAKFREIYEISLVEDDAKLAKVKFVPKGAASGETLLAEIDKDSYLLRSLTSESSDSRVRTEFTDTQINLKLKDSQFEYQPGPNDIVHKH